MKSTAFYTKNEAEKYISEYRENEKYLVQELVDDCWNYTPPREINQWSGEISIFKVSDKETLETIEKVAYWEE